MSRFDRVLRDDDLADIFALGIGDLSAKPFNELVVVLEKAVLEKLTEQEPVAYLYADEVYGSGDSDITNYIIANGDPLYAHPMPNSQGILDSSKTITKENLPPLPEPHCKHGGGIGYFDSYSKEQMIEYAKSAIDRHKAMLAAPQPTNSAHLHRNLIRALALKNGFTLKGEDLHEYVYNFANELASVVADATLITLIKAKE